MQSTFDYSVKNSAKLSIGDRGEKDGQFDWPRGVAVDLQTDNIFVSERDVERIQVFSQRGTFLYNFPTIIPRNFFICISGNLLYMTNFYSHSLSVYTLDGNFITTFGKCGNQLGQFSFPQGIGIDEDFNRLFICDRDNHRVQVFGGVYTQAITRIGSSTLSIPRDLKYYLNDLYVMDKNHIHIFTPFFPYTHRKSILEIDFSSKNPYYFIIDPNMNIVLSNYKSSSIEIFDREGELLHTIGTGGSTNGPNGIALSQQGDIVCVLTNKDSGLLQIF